MEWGIFELLIGFGIIFLIVYYYFIISFNFWSIRGVPYPTPTVPFGNLKDTILGKVFVGDYLLQQYENFKDQPMFGIYNRQHPILIVNDPNYIKDILIKEFSSFADRGLSYSEKAEPLSHNLVTHKAALWRSLRKKLTPIFTLGKLKDMFNLLSATADYFENYMERCVKKNPVIDCREITSKYTTDVIVVCVFGLSTKTLSDEDSQFRRIGKKIFHSTIWKIIKLQMMEISPWVLDLLWPIAYDYELNNFFIGLMRDTMKHRIKNNIKRKDFVDLIIEIKNNQSEVNDIELTDTLIAAEAFIIFAAGFETSSMTMSNVLYELALNPSVQSKLREEVKKTYEDNNGELKFETVKNMKYMEKVVLETLRKYPPIPVLPRKSTTNYRFSGSNVSIPKGTRVWIPVYALQHDPVNYPDPETFDPERFENNVNQGNMPIYMPFGDGPRNCIGKNFANHQIKMGLIKILKNFMIEACSETCIPYVHDPTKFLLYPMGGIKLKFTQLH